MGGFRFKHFSVEQERSAMKVGTDGVLLGAWTPLGDDDLRLLDVGTGTGLIALMLAQRHPTARITALDLDEGCVADARENVARSPWSERIEVCCMAVQAYSTTEPYDLVVSNPPYFEDSLHSPLEERTRARHTQSLSFEELISAAHRLLRPHGGFAVVLPADAARHFQLLAASHFSLERRLEVRTTPTKPPKRTLMLFRKGALNRMQQCEELVIQTAPETFTPQYRALTGDFYLKF